MSDIPATTVLTTCFQQAAVDHARRKAIFCGPEKIRYREAWDRSLGFARLLVEEYGVRPGDRVGLLMKNCSEFIYAVYGILLSGATVVPINNFLKAQEIEYILHDAGIDTLVTSAADFQDVLRHLQERMEALRPLDMGKVRLEELEQRPLKKLPEIHASTRAVIIYTSGTTGRPKGAVLTHGNIVANIQSCVAVLGSVSRDRVVLVLPMFHTFMMTVSILLPLSTGAAIIIIKSLKPFRNVLFEMIKKRASVFPGIPQIFQALATAKIPWWLRMILPLRLAVSGSAPLPGETLSAFGRRFRFPLLEGYGLSEAAPVVCFNPLHGASKPGSVGPAIPGVQVRIFDENDHDLGCNQDGEIVVRGDNVMLGYWNQEEATAAVLRGGWLRTGDIGRLDQDGYLFITDRKKDMLLVHGNNVYPREIEEVIYQVPGVREVAVVGRIDQHRGEVPVAFVVPAEGAQLEASAIMKFCRERLADYKLPRDIRVGSNALPRNALGKILKTELRKRIQDEIR